MIFQDFDKIHFHMFGMELVEPMAIIMDTLLGLLSLYFAYRVSKIKSELPFYSYWKYFFLIFGVGAILGGLGHTFYIQWGVAGKFPSWICGPLSVYAFEQAMISIHPNSKRVSAFKLASFIKLLIVSIAFILICVNAPISEKPQLPFLPIAINTILGVSFTGGILGLRYKKLISANYRYFYLGVLIMLPSAFIFLMKINLHQWFDKNDLSHLLMGLGIIYFAIGVLKVWKEFKSEHQS